MKRVLLIRIRNKIDWNNDFIYQKQIKVIALAKKRIKSLLWIDTININISRYKIK